MSKCVYCKKDINVVEPKFISLIHQHEFVCERCVWQEDVLWFTSKYKEEYPDFSEELEGKLKFS